MIIYVQAEMYYYVIIVYDAINSENEEGLARALVSRGSRLSLLAAGDRDVREIGKIKIRVYGKRQTAEVTT